jgi:pyruvate dehydrogenase E2 component (dihydrolipoamide acetyltransferase)
MGAVAEVKVPDIGDFKDIPIIEIMVKAGDTVKPEDPLVSLESDKATMEVPAPSGGTVKELKVKLGDKVSEGSVILLLDSGRAEQATPPAVMPKTAVSAPPSPTSAPGGIAEVRVPDIGDFKDVPVIEIFVKPGDAVKAEDPLVTLESDKATMEVPSPLGGTVQSVNVKVGDKVSEGAVVLTLSTGSVAVAPRSTPAPATAAAAAPAPTAKAVASAASASAIDEVAFGLAYAGPGVRKLARELGVDLGSVKGTGNKGRIQREDVESFAKNAPPAAKPAAAAASAGGGVGGIELLPWPKVDFTKFGAIETKPLSRIKKISGANLHRNWVTIPHVTQFEEADISEMEAFRKELGVEYAKQDFKITPLAFMLKASAITLKHFPDFNASLDASGENLVLKKYTHIGVAVDTPDGLMVPVIRDVDQKGIVQLAKELGEVSARAREKKITSADMQGGCFTISSLGGIGGTAFTPIINAPEVAILGVSRSSMKPVWKDGEFVPRLMLPLSLSYDHRVIDGAAGARFTTYLAHVLSDMRRLAL